MSTNNFNGIRGYALNAIGQNPELRKDPQYQEMIRAIEQNDAQTGMALANQILQRYGVSKNAAIDRAIQLFGFSQGSGR